MSKRDYYEVLGVAKTVTPDEIKKAYRVLAKKYHPDVNKEPGAEERFKEINEANEVLSDPQKRAQYDRFGHAGPQGGFGQGGFSGFSGNFEDIFSEFFGGFSGFGGGSSQEEDSDIQLAITLTFYEALKGTSKKVTYKRNTSCSACDGTGDANKAHPLTCTACNGRGYVIKQQQTMFGIQRMQTECNVCDGRGVKVANPCKTCKGKGTQPETVTLTVTIPQGVDHGEVLTVTGKGNKTIRDTGNLYLHIQVGQSKYFERHNMDLYTIAYIDPILAIVGGQQEVITPWGPVQFTVPSGIEQDKKIKILGYGVKKPNKQNLFAKAAGDLFVVIKLAKPDYTQDQIKQLQELLNKNNKYVKDYLDDVKKEVAKNEQK